jgi:hypothetical protein
MVIFRALELSVVVASPLVLKKKEPLQCLGPPKDEILLDKTSEL